MDKYTIYCTAEQTKKALELGAPIRTFGYPDLGEIKEKVLKLNRQAELHTTDEGGLMVGQIPTAEQMIGWLEEQGVEVRPMKIRYRDNTSAYAVSILNNDGRYLPYKDRNYPSRKEVTLAAIDAALDYLIKNKE